MAENDQKKIMMIAIFVAAIIIIAIILLPTPSERAIIRASDLGSSNYREEQFYSKITFHFRKDNPIGNDTLGAQVQIINYNDRVGIFVQLYTFKSNGDARTAMAERADYNGFNSTSSIDFADEAILGRYPTTYISIYGYTSVSETIKLFFVKGNAYAEISLDRYWIIGVNPNPTESITDLVMWIGTIQMDKIVR